MDKTAIKNFAIQARKDLISGVKQKAYEYGIDEKTTGNEAPTGALLNGRILTSEEQTQRNELLNLIKTKGYDQVMEEVAYTWFNRFIALRFMEVNEYLPSRIRVFTNDKNEFQPEILSEALHLEMEGLDKAKVISLLESNQTEEFYKYLLIIQCNDLNSALPEMFEKIQNYTELLFPNNLLKAGSILSCMISSIQQEDWKEDVEIIGWLYQYYNTEVKDETFALLSKNIKITKERIPAATQLFTPDWIVRYMVENSLGRLWIEGHPSDELKSNWKYYLDEAEQEPEVEEQLQKIRADYAKIKPKEIKVIDPCMGSGHILVYAFDVLMQIYIATGYSEREAAMSVIQNNLFGLDIDDRAYQLSYFAVMMKARKQCRTIFSAGIRPNLYSIQESNFVTPELIDYVADGDENIKYDLKAIIETMHDAKEYGSILIMPNVNYEKIFSRLMDFQTNAEIDLQKRALHQIAVDSFIPLILQARVMSKKYDIVVTNPPYMGNGGMSEKLSVYLKNIYPDSKPDLFAVFIERCGKMTRRLGFQAMITQHSWMFLSSYESLRKKLINQNLINMAHLGARAFEEINGEVVQATTFVLNYSCIHKYKGSYVRLVEYSNQKGKEDAFLLKQNIHIADQLNFAKIKGMPISYWVSEKMFKIFEGAKCLRDFGEPRHGMSTGNNDVCLKLWFEVNYRNIAINCSSYSEFENSGRKWIPYNKGGTYRKWYGNNDYIIAYDKKSLEYMTKLSGYRSASTNFFFRPSINWSDVSSNLGARYSDQGFAFDGRGASMFCPPNIEKYLLAIMNSKFANAVLKILNPTLTFNIDNIASIPIIYNESYNNKIATAVHQNISISKIDWDSFETSWDFITHPLTLFKSSSGYGSDKIKRQFRVEKAFAGWKENSGIAFNKLKANEEELNGIFINIYGLQDELTSEVDNYDIAIHKANLEREIRSLLSYAVGVTLGRYSLDIDGLAYAGGDWDDNKYETIIPDKDNILPISDNVYFEDDIVSKVVDFVKVIYGEETLEENLQFIADALSNRGDSSREVIRNYFLNDFFKDHLKIYQKRPIYWLFDSGKKNGFKALIYMHRYKPDLLATMRTDYVHEQQERYRTQLQYLESSMQHASPADQAKINKQIGKLKEQFLELLGYEEKVHHLADQMIDINLDDGVKVNYAKFEEVLALIK